ncbi:DUF1365 domain-containing protein [Paracoccus stylophorae]|uniref:DUF1365 domain-containing protein n=1 Tax=Paracoccus stylophorae TaxID=659350 RepID=A0ABY7SUY1_9RHOB|nr:DUF1365 domain-containing protein [Paracoccus stylophorae]WCR10668.1 DUF1365 domain-containing protein [Paracoccus stylophorae]
MTSLWDGALIEARIWHGRRGDVARDFRYFATYVAVPIAAIDRREAPLAVDRAGLWSIRSRDYGDRDGRPLRDFIAGLLAPAGLEDADDVTLVTLPRSSGHGFNPVSFWLCRDPAADLRAVLAEVSNTFGERHFYLCHRPDRGTITASDRLHGDKLFHVSPFLPRSGGYRFRFDTGPGRFGAWIDWLAADGSRMLGTSMVGPARDLTRASVRRAALRHPFQSQKVIALIHLQAARIRARGIAYLRKPPQLSRRVSRVQGTDGKGE